MPLSCLCGFGPRVAADRRRHAGDIREVGSANRIRSVDTGERRFVHEQQLEVFDMRFIDEMGGAADQWSWRYKIWIADTHLHVSFDVDFLDPEIAPGVGTTVPGGLSTTAKHSCAWK